MIRHGEIIIVPAAELPEGANVMQRESLIVGHSETGHHHVLECSQPFDVANTANAVFVRLMADAKLRHEKTGPTAHDTKTVPAGTYKIRRKKEYDFVAKAMREVWD